MTAGAAAEEFYSQSSRYEPRVQVHPIVPSFWPDAASGLQQKSQVSCAGLA
jgi:hypothetical protein